jgi:O-antigen ligase
MCEIDFIACTRFSGMFGSELIAGGYLSQIGLLFFFLSTSEDFKKSSYKKITIYAFIPFLFLIIILTGERNALLIFLICISIICFFYKKVVVFLITITIFTLIFLLAVQNSLSIKARYLNLFTASTSTIESSIKEKIMNTPWSYHYQTAFEMFLEKPILGHGYKNFRVKCSETEIDKKLFKQRIKYRNYRGCSTHPHNYMMEMLSENGMVGFLFFVTIIFMIFNKILRTRNYSKSKYQFLTISIGSILLALLFPFKPSGSFFSTFNASIFFYLLGFFLYYAKRSKQE